MKVTIAIPVYNGERFLEAALASALSQSLPADEMLVVDDASTDQSANVCHSSRWSGRIRYHYNAQPSGFADAWNRVVGMASGDFVAILHQDDLLEPDFLKTMAEMNGRFPTARHLFCAADYIDAKGATIRAAEGHAPAGFFLWSGQEYASRYLQGVVTNQHIHRCPGVMTERRLLLEDCSYRKEAGLIADDDFFYRVGAFTDVTGIGRPLAKFRLHKESVSARADLTRALARDYLFQAQLYAKDAGLFSEADCQRLFGLAVRFINQAFYEALLEGDQSKTEEALIQRRELDVILPGFMKRRLPLWARPMWWLASRARGKGFDSASMYARAVHTAAKVRRVNAGRENA